MQSPFLSVCLYINEDPNYLTENVEIIEEFLKQRIQGLQDESGTWVTPAFPKLLYFLDENNTKGGEYYWLTKLAAKCTAKRLVPDYISVKKMKELKEGNAFPPMGCVHKDEVITYKYNNELYVESFSRAWDRFSSIFPVLTQPNGIDKYIDLQNVTIYDNGPFVECKRIIKNSDKHDWVKIKTLDGRLLTCTKDHPLPVVGKGRVLVKDLQIADKIEVESNFYNGNDSYDNELAWVQGLLLYKSFYSSGTFHVKFPNYGEDDIINRLQSFCKSREVDSYLQIFPKHVGYKKVGIDTDQDIRFRKNFINELTSSFGGINKSDRKIPNEIFNANKEARLHFLGGIIDAVGDTNILPGKSSEIDVCSTNKELSLELLLLVNSLGLKGRIIEVSYGIYNPDLIPWKVSFKYTKELLNYITCQRKKSRFIECNEDTISGSFVSEIQELETDNEYSYDVTTSSDTFSVSGIHSHNCRSFLSPWKDENGNYKFYGRFNLGVITLNFVDLALSSGGNWDKFYKLFDERMDLIHRTHKKFIDILANKPSDVAPISYQYGAAARLKPGEKIGKLFYGGRATCSFGYAGLYECIKYMTGQSHSHGIGFEKGIEIMKHFNDLIDKYKGEDNIGYSPYGSPIESTTYKFAKCLKKRFGIINGITDHDYITNSYHINVREEIDPFKKLKVEAEYQKYSLGGCISYTESSDMQHNIPAVLEVIDFMYNNIMYAEINSKSDHCCNCGYTGEQKIDENMNWYCPNCGCTDSKKLYHARRVCGYIGVSDYNKGRTEEIKERFVHLDNHDEV